MLSFGNYLSPNPYIYNKQRPAHEDKLQLYSPLKADEYFISLHFKKGNLSYFGPQPFLLNAETSLMLIHHTLSIKMRHNETLNTHSIGLCRLVTIIVICHEHIYIYV